MRSPAFPAAAAPPPSLSAPSSSANNLAAAPARSLRTAPSQEERRGLERGELGRGSAMPRAAGPARDVATGTTELHRTGPWGGGSRVLWPRWGAKRPRGQGRGGHGSGRGADAQAAAPADQAAARPAAGPGAHPQITCDAGSAILARAPRSGSGGSGVTALAVGNGPKGSSTFFRRLNLKWTAALRQPRGAGGEGRRGRKSIPVPVWPRLWLRGYSRNGARPLAAPRTAQGRPAHRAGALARCPGKQAPARPVSPPLARHHDRKQWLKWSRDLYRQVALSRAFAFSRGLARLPEGAEGWGDGSEAAMVWLHLLSGPGDQGDRRGSPAARVPAGLWNYGAFGTPLPSLALEKPCPRSFRIFWAPCQGLVIGFCFSAS